MKISGTIAKVLTVDGQRAAILLPDVSAVVASEVGTDFYMGNHRIQTREDFNGAFDAWEAMQEEPDVDEAALSDAVDQANDAHDKLMATIEAAGRAAASLDARTLYAGGKIEVVEPNGVGGDVASEQPRDPALEGTERSEG